MVVIVGVALVVLAAGIFILTLVIRNNQAAIRHADEIDCESDHATAALIRDLLALSVPAGGKVPPETLTYMRQAEERIAKIDCVP